METTDRFSECYLFSNGVEGCKIAEKLFERNIFEKYVRIYLLKVNNKSSLKAQEKTFMLKYQMEFYTLN